MYDHMQKSDQSLLVDRGMALHKMIRLITLATAGGGYLNFMGNEFGHPEWIDFPREGNQWSYKYARRQWSLMDRDHLRYHLLSDFDRAMIGLTRQEQVLNVPFPFKWHAHDTDQVLAFERGSLVFLFNFHPNQSYTDYGIHLPPGKYQLVLNTDSSKYGGYGNVKDEQLYFTKPAHKISSNTAHFLMVYLPSRTAMVLKKIPTRSLKDLV
jgi:1,4-alpha-glucan branching enzyme